MLPRGLPHLCWRGRSLALPHGLIWSRVADVAASTLSRLLGCGVASAPSLRAGQSSRRTMLRTSARRGREVTRSRHCRGRRRSPSPSTPRRPHVAPPAPPPARGRLHALPVRRRGAWPFSIPAVATPILITHDYLGPAPLLWARRDAVALHGPRGRRQSSLTGSVITEVVKSS